MMRSAVTRQIKDVGGIQVACVEVREHCRHAVRGGRIRRSVAPRGQDVPRLALTLAAKRTKQLSQTANIDDRLDRRRMRQLVMMDVVTTGFIAATRGKQTAVFKNVTVGAVAA